MAKPAYHKFATAWVVSVGRSRYPRQVVSVSGFMAHAEAIRAQLSECYPHLTFLVESWGMEASDGYVPYHQGTAQALDLMNHLAAPSPKEGREGS